MNRIQQIWLGVLLFGIISCCEVYGQNPSPESNALHSATQTEIVIRQADHQSLLPLIQKSAQTGAIELQTSRSEIEEAPQVGPALRHWVASGGIVLLHNDAAQLFGYKTVRARERTNRTAGQLFGRARNAVAPAASPLMWDTSKTAGTRTAGIPGVRVIHYRMQPGDHLVQDHAAGVPLLRVTDLVVPPAPSLFAAVIAPYGRGWAIFTPRFVETHRADGAMFMQNLLSFVQRASVAGRRSRNGLIGVPVASIESSVEGAVQALGTTETATWDYQGLERALSDAIEPTPADDSKQFAPDQAVPSLLLTREEVTAALDRVQGIQLSSADALHKRQMSRQIAAVVVTWAARLHLQRNNMDKALSLLESLKGLVPKAAEVNLWRGVLMANRADDITMTAREQAYLLEEAVQAWQQTLTAPFLLAANAPRAGNNDRTQDDPDLNNIDDRGTLQRSVSGVPLSLLSLWRERALSAAEVVRRLPLPVTIPQHQPEDSDYIKVMGTADSPLVIRQSTREYLGTFGGPVNTWQMLWGGESGPKYGPPRISINGLRITRPPNRADRLLSRASAALGWRPDREEIVVFPAPGPYAQYHRVIGMPQQMPLPVIDINQEVFKRTMPKAGMVPKTPSFGDVVGDRLLMSGGMMSGGSFSWRGKTNAPVDVPRTNNPASTLYPTTLGRMHSYVLMNQLAGGGTSPPDWMQLGLAARSALSVMRDLGLDLPDTGFSATEVSPAFLGLKMGEVGVLNPAQFKGITLDPQRCPLAEPQAILMMEFFYARFGTACVVETLQRLGSGQTVDEALNATTELTEAQFFQAWSAAMR